MWNNIESFDEEKGEFKNWIAAISKYKAIDYKRKFFKESTVEDIDNYYNLCDEISTENVVVSKENRKEVLNAINNMKDEDREIFIRRYFLIDKTVFSPIGTYISLSGNYKDENGERINFKDHYDIKRNEENPNEFKIELK